MIDVETKFREKSNRNESNDITLWQHINQYMPDHNNYSPDKEREKKQEAVLKCFTFDWRP